MIYELANFSHTSIGYELSIALPFIILLVLAYYQLSHPLFSLPIFASLFAIYPALTPGVTAILGYEYFTRLNYDLQHDQVLEIASTYLISGFCICLMIGAVMAKTAQSIGRLERYILPLWCLVPLFSLLLALLVMFLEKGTVLWSSYGEVKSAGNAPYSSLVNQMFNVNAAIFLSYLGGRKRQRVIAVVYIVVITFALLTSRRTLALAVLVLSLYSFDLVQFRLKQVALILIVLFLFVLVGEARVVGLFNYFQGDRREVSEIPWFSLPGGASNIFVGTMGVIDLIGSDVLTFPDRFPLSLWPLGIYESNIYSKYPYDYNGGMHIANILYWNGGLPGVIFGGLFVGWIVKKVHTVALRLRNESAATLPAMLSIGFILVLPNFFWYHPIGLLKLSCAILVGYLILMLARRGTSESRLVRS
ncbi:MAG: hypothetical protein ABJK25_14105 [Halieaceae bacterium]